MDSRICARCGVIRTGAGDTGKSAEHADGVWAPLELAAGASLVLGGPRPSKSWPALQWCTAMAALLIIAQKALEDPGESLVRDALSLFSPTESSRQAMVPVPGDDTNAVLTVDLETHVLPVEGLEVTRCRADDQSILGADRQKALSVWLLAGASDTLEPVAHTRGHTTVLGGERAAGRAAASKASVTGERGRHLSRTHRAG